MPTHCVSIVIPALDEAQSIRASIERIPIDRLAALGVDFEIIVVDNGSTDGTSDIAREAGATVVLELRRGYGRAYKTGYGRARGDIIASMDADLTYPSEVIPDLVNAMLTQEYDFITTNRMSGLAEGSMTLGNRLGNQVLSFLGSRIFGIPLKDLQSGMWIIRRSLLEALDLQADGMSFTDEIKIRALAGSDRWLEVPIVYRPRLGVSKLRPMRDGWAMLVTIVRVGIGRRRKPR